MFPLNNPTKNILIIKTINASLVLKSYNITNIIILANPSFTPGTGIGINPSTILNTIDIVNSEAI
jgi:hypothetical protein